MALCAWSAEPKLSNGEVEQGKLYLEQTRALVIGATKGLSGAQWKFKPTPERWSIAEIVEHITLTQDLMLGPIREQLAKAPAGAARDTKAIDSTVIGRLPDRTQKFQAPDFLVPTGRWEPQAALERLMKDYDRLIEYLQSTPDLRQHVVEAIPIKAVSNGAYDTMDGYEWILATGAHTERHVKQILEVKADPAFPAR
jgi:hypothetical protein